MNGDWYMPYIMSLIFYWIAYRSVKNYFCYELIFKAFHNLNKHEYEMFKTCLMKIGGSFKNRLEESIEEVEWKFKKSDES